jgi:AcrR family transcriptional regulator
MPNTSIAADCERIRSALVAVVAERGYAGTTLDPVLERAGVDSGTFEDCFSSLDECFAEVWEECQGEVVERTSTAFLAAGDWRRGMRAAAWQLCRWADENRERAQILFVELSYANELVRASRDRTFRVYADLIHAGRFEREQTADVPRATAEAVMGAIWERLVITVRAGTFDRLPTQVPEMMYLLVLPFLGPEAAREELRRRPEDIARYRRGEI